MLIYRRPAAPTRFENEVASKGRRRVVVVCGGGAAGIAASLAAAEHGAEVCLVEQRSKLGGTVTHSLIHTLGGVFDSKGQLLQEGLVAELVDRLTSCRGTARRRRMGRLWVLNVSPDDYGRVVEGWVAGLPRIAVWRHGRVSRIALATDKETKVGGRVTGMEIVGEAGRLSVEPDCVIDATGSASMVRQIDPGLVQENGKAVAGGMVVRIRGIVPGTLDFPKGLELVRSLRQAAASGALPGTCGQAWIDSGCYPDEAFVKLFVPIFWEKHCRLADVINRAQRDREEILGFLRRLPGYANATVVECGDLGIRDGGRVWGEYRLTESDVRQLRKFEDAACRGCWPIEYWDARQGVSLAYLPDDGYYDIPLRSLRVKGWRNVWVAGKCLSADAYAQASARVVGTCWAMGEAVGKAAAQGTEIGSTNEFSTI